MLKKYKELKQLNKVDVKKEDVDVDNIGKARITYDIYDEYSGVSKTTNVFHLSQNEIQNMIDRLQSDIDKLNDQILKITKEKEDLEELLADAKSLDVVLKIEKPSGIKIEKP